jgi:hypothetical protein
MAKARYNNGSVILELPIITNNGKTLDLAHPEGVELPEGADVKTRLKVSGTPIQTEGDLKQGYCRPLVEGAEESANEKPDDAQTAAGSDADVPARAKKAK